jgi:Bacterial toxin 33
MGMSDDFWWKALATAGLAILKGGEYIITGSEKAVDALYRSLMKSHQGSGSEGDKGKEGERNPAQDKELNKGEIKRLKQGDVDIHELKGGKNASKRDLFKDKEGNIYIKPKGGRGRGEDTGLNVKHY